MSSPITPLTPQETTAAEANAGHESWIRRVLAQGDIFLNVLRGGPNDVTISTSAALAAEHGSHIGGIVSELLDKFQKDHGAKAAAGDMERAEQAEQQIAAAKVIDQGSEP